MHGCAELRLSLLTVRSTTRGSSAVRRRLPGSRSLVQTSTSTTTCSPRPPPSRRRQKRRPRSTDRRARSVIAAAAPRVHRSRHILQSLDMYSRRQPPDRTRIWTSHRPQPASSQFAIGSLFVASAPSIACSRAAHADGQSSLRLHRGRQISARVSRGAARRSGAQSSRAVLDTAVGIAAERSARSIDTDRGHAQRCPVSRLDGRSEG